MCVCVCVQVHVRVCYRLLSEVKDDDDDDQCVILPVYMFGHFCVGVCMLLFDMDHLSLCLSVCVLVCVV